MTDNSDLERLLELEFEQFKVDAFLRKPLTELEKNERQQLKDKINKVLERDSDNEKIVALFVKWNETKLTDNVFATQVISILGTKRYCQISESEDEKQESPQ